MRDPRRITRIITILEKVWQTQSDLRLGQLLLNLATLYDFDLYYLEDNKLERLLKKEVKV